MRKLDKLRDICFGRFTLTSHQQMEFERLIRFCRNQSTGLRNILLSISRWSVSLMCRSPDHLLARLLCHSHRETLVGAVHTPAVARWDKLDPETPDTPDTPDTPNTPDTPDTLTKMVHTPSMARLIQSRELKHSNTNMEQDRKCSLLYRLPSHL